MRTFFILIFLAIVFITTAQKPFYGSITFISKEYDSIKSLRVDTIKAYYAKNKIKLSFKMPAEIKKNIPNYKSTINNEMEVIYDCSTKACYAKMSYAGLGKYIKVTMQQTGNLFFMQSKTTDTLMYGNTTLQGYSCISTNPTLTATFWVSDGFKMDNTNTLKDTTMLPILLGNFIPFKTTLYQNKIISAEINAIKIEKDSTLKIADFAIDYTNVYDPMPELEKMYKNLKDTGVLYKPKDKVNNTNNIYTRVEIEASYKGSLRNYIKNNMQIPEKYINTTFNEVVNVGFSIEKDGTITNVEILESTNKDFNKEAIRLITNTSGNWKPQILNGSFYTSKQNFLVEFIR